VTCLPTMQEPRAPEVKMNDFRRSCLSNEPFAARQSCRSSLPRRTFAARQSACELPRGYDEPRRRNLRPLDFHIAPCLVAGRSRLRSPARQAGPTFANYRSASPNGRSPVQPSRDSAEYISLSVRLVHRCETSDQTIRPARIVRWAEKKGVPSDVRSSV
jgi:hypothetical protein